MSGMTVPSIPAPDSPLRHGLSRGELLGFVGGVLLVGVGAWFASRPYSSGWFAYAPLSGETFEPPQPLSRTLGQVALVAACWSSGSSPAGSSRPGEVEGRRRGRGSGPLSTRVLYTGNSRSAWRGRIVP
ncbi:hypothetical protein NKG05_15570 [Oerskovia sp. M15]